MTRFNPTLLILSLVIGIIIGYIMFAKEIEPEIITKTEFKTDTIYIEIRDTIKLTKTEIKQEYLRDTILIDFKPKIKAFKASKSFLHGNTRISGEVLGEVLKMDIYNDFKIPQVTNTITNTNTIVKKPQGLFLTAGVTKQLGFTPSIGVTFVRDKYLIGVSNTDFKFGYKLGK